MKSHPLAVPPSVRSLRVALAVLFLGTAWAQSTTVGLRICDRAVVPPGGPTTAAANFQVFSNGIDLVYAGLGAGGSQVPGVDGMGSWFAGEDLHGVSLTYLGDFGYKQTGLRKSLCVYGASTPNLSIDLPVMTVVEFAGSNGHMPAVFSVPQCNPGAGFPLGNSVGLIPYLPPAGASASFMLVNIPPFGLPSAVIGGPTCDFINAITCPIPNQKLMPTTLGGTATLIAVGSVNIPIASTGFCWTVQMMWSPTCLALKDDIVGISTWDVTSRDGNQYWAMSNDELNTWQSQSFGSDNGVADIVTFFANADYATHMLSADPVTNDALAPVGWNATGTYYATGLGVPGSGNSFNGGFDLGRHGALSLGGSSGVPNPHTGFGNQDPAGSPGAGLAPTLGFVTWDVAADGSADTRLTWVQTDVDLTFGIDPAFDADAVVAFGSLRVPVPIPATPGPWPMPETISFFPFLIHDVADRTAVPGWLDPDGFAPGAFGIPPVVGSSIHLPTGGGAAVCIGLPVALSYGSTAMASASGPLVWGLGPGGPSVGRQLSLFD